MRRIRHRTVAFPGFDTAWVLVSRFVCAGLVSVAGVSSVHAERLENSVAVFAALDKVTAKIQRLEVPLGETAPFGTLKVTPRVCLSRPATERPKTTSFVEIQETELDGTENKIFSGWMFAQSPGLHAVEHPVFDIWLTDCAKPLNAPAADSAAADAGPKAGEGDSAGEAAAPPVARRRPPRRRVRR